MARCAWQPGSNGTALPGSAGHISSFPLSCGSSPWLHALPQVYKAKDINTGKLVALKKTRLEVCRFEARVNGRGSTPAATESLSPMMPRRWRRRACLPQRSAKYRCCRC